MKMYAEFAPWWPLLSSPEDYVEEAAIYAGLLTGACAREPKSMLELGSGGGNNACHMKAHFETVTLVEPAAGMRAHSEKLNPECEHLDGDMRSLRLGRAFDCVFVHDAVVYMLTEEDLRRAIETAFVHCEVGGAAIFCPDHTRENFKPATECGGHDDGARGLRYLSWSWDPDPSDTTYVGDYAYMVRDENGETTVAHDRHIAGLFSRETWLTLMRDVGFEAECAQVEHTEVDYALDILVGKRR